MSWYYRRIIDLALSCKRDFQLPNKGQLASPSVGRLGMVDLTTSVTFNYSIYDSID